MSTPAAQAREKRRRATGEAYFVRPPDEPRNSPVPRYGWLVQHAMIASDGVIYKSIESLKPAILRTGERVLHNASITRIAKATAAFTLDGRAMPRRTVAHRLAAMRRKGILTVWEARATTSPVGTNWRLPRFTDVLERWKQDPEIYTPKNRAFCVRGKERSFVTPERAIALQLNADAAERNPAAHASAVAIEEPATAAPAPAAAPLDLEPLMHALIDVSGRGDLKDAGFIWAEVVRSSGSRELPPVDLVAATVRKMGADWRKVGQQAPLDHGLIRKRIAGHLEAWRKHRREEAAAIAKAARWERDERINRLAGYMQQLAREDLDPADRALYAEQLAAADAGELEAASRALTRTA